MDSRSIFELTPPEFFTSHSANWRRVLDFVQLVKEGKSAGQATEMGHLGFLEEKGQKINGSIWDPKIFGEEEQGKGEARWGHAIVHHVVHPALFETIGNLLGLSAEEVRLVAWWRGTVINGSYESLGFPTDHPSGPRLLKDLLAALPLDLLAVPLSVHPSELVFDTLPIPPRWMRPSKKSPGPGKQACPEDLLFNAMVYQSKIMDFFWEDKGESESLRLLFEQQASLPIQRMLEQLILHYESGGEWNRWDFERNWSGKLPVGEQSWGFFGEELDLPELIHPEVMAGAEWEKENAQLWARQRHVPTKLLVHRGDGLLVQYMDRVVLLNPEKRQRLGEWMTYGDLLGPSADDSHLFYRYFGQICLLHLDSGEWREQLPPGEFRFMDNFDMEGAFLADLRRDQAIRLLEVKDDHTLEVRSADGKYVWVEDREANGGIYSFETGWLVVDVGFLELEDEPFFLRRDGTLESLSPAAVEMMEEALSEAADAYLELDMDLYVNAEALALVDGDWWIFAFNTLWINLKPVWRVDMPVTAAAFGTGDSRLFLANKDEIRIVEMNPRGIPTSAKSIPISFI